MKSAESLFVSRRCRVCRKTITPSDYQKGDGFFLPTYGSLCREHLEWFLINSLDFNKPDAEEVMASVLKKWKQHQKANKTYFENFEKNLV